MKYGTPEKRQGLGNRTFKLLDPGWRMDGWNIFLVGFVLLFDMTGNWQEVEPKPGDLLTPQRNLCAYG